MTSSSGKSVNGQDGSDEEIRDQGGSTRLAPLVAALGCPLSSLLAIPVLTEHWAWAPSVRSHTLDAGIIISVILGFLANFFLIFRYFEYRPQLSTLAAIASLTFHDCLNLVILIIVIIRTRGSSPALSQAVWMMVASSVISIFCNLALVVDYVLVDNFRAKGSGLTTKQRTLAIVTMCLLLYIGFGAVVFALMESQRLTFSNALYFSVCTVTTVGFGDITPTRSITRVFTFFYAIAGIILLALTVSTSRDTIIEAFESFFQSRRRAIAQSVREIRFNKSFTRPLSNIVSEDSDAILSDGREPGQGSSRPRQWSFWPFRGKFAFRKSFSLRKSSENQTDAFKQFQDRLLKEEKRELRTRLIVASFLFSCFWLLGGVVFKFTEGWTYGEALYFGYVAFLTLGYGDYTVRSPGGRAFYIAWSLLGIGNMTLLLAVLTQAWEVKYKRAISKSRQRKLALTREATAQILSVDEEVQSHKYEHEQHEHDNVEQILDQLIETAQDFSKHAQFWMNGKTGVPPPSLVQMTQEAEKVEDFDRVLSKGGLVDTVTSEERRRVLFLISFSKSFEVLTQQVFQVKEAIQANAEHLAALQTIIKNHDCASPISSPGQASPRSASSNNSPSDPKISFKT